jgi:hypothetical protein
MKVRQKQQVPPKRQYLLNRLHGDRSQIAARQIMWEAELYERGSRWKARRLNLGMVRNDSLPQNIQTGAGANSASYSMGTGDSFLGLDLPGRRVDYWAPSNDEVRNEWSCTSTTFSMPSWRVHGKISPWYF